MSDRVASMAAVTGAVVGVDSGSEVAAGASVAAGAAGAELQAARTSEA